MLMTRSPYGRSTESRTPSNTCGGFSVTEAFGSPAQSANPLHATENFLLRLRQNDTHVPEPGSIKRVQPQCSGVALEHVTEIVVSSSGHRGRNVMAPCSSSTMSRPMDDGTTTALL